MERGVEVNIPTTPSASVKRLNPHLYGGAERRNNLPAVKPQVRESGAATKSIKLNKLETAYYRKLKEVNAWVGVQCITLKLGIDAVTRRISTIGNGILKPLKRRAALGMRKVEPESRHNNVSDVGIRANDS
jgi:hypothetical protein